MGKPEELFLLLRVVMVLGLVCAFCAVSYDAASASSSSAARPTADAAPEPVRNIRLTLAAQKTKTGVVWLQRSPMERRHRDHTLVGTLQQPG